jgi:hypothetical protein
MSAVHFDTLTALAQHVETLPIEEGYDNSLWAGGTHEYAIKLASEGWPEGARLASEKATRMATRLVEATGMATYQSIEYDVIGAAYDAGAVALGIPEAWGVMAPQEAKRAIRIVLNIAVSGGVPASSITARGLAVTALVLALQARGYPVTVDVTQGSGNKLADVTVTLSDASTGSQLDVDRLAYGLAHPTMFRRLLRAATCGVRNEGRSMATSCWDYSSVADDKVPLGDLYLGSAHLNQVGRWQDGGEKWILDEYIRQTGA